MAVATSAWLRALLGGARSAALLCLFAVAPLAAQEPQPRDTIPAPRDTAIIRIPPEEVAQDTLPAAPDAAPADTVRPALNFPVFPAPAPEGWSEARWEWDAAALARWHGLSLLELLEQVPGLVVTRTGSFGRAAGLAAFGSGGGRVRVFLDGYELDPLSSAVFDLQQLAVVDLYAVRVERLLSETRIEIFPFRLPEGRPFSQIEAGTGDFNTRILRGLFSTTAGGRGVLTLGLDLTDTDGWLRREPFSIATGLARFSYALTESAGLQLEYRQASLDRGGVRDTAIADRQDLIFRARASPLPNLAVDAIVGRSWREAQPGDEIGVDLASTQGALRARAVGSWGWLGGAARLRNAGRTGITAATLDLSLEGGLQPLERVGATASIRHSRAGEVGGLEVEGGVRLGPVAGVSLFVNGAAGSRGVGLLRDARQLIGTPGNGEDADEDADDLRAYSFPYIASGIGAVRAGVEWTGWGIRLGGAFVSHDAELIAPFALPFDRRAEPIESDPATGIESYFSVPLLYRPLRLEGSYTRWADIGGRPYLPVEHGRAALVFNELFYEGNLEPTLRIEGVYRGGSIVPLADRATFGAIAAPYTLLNIFLQIRVLDVRAFLLFENVLQNLAAADLPGAPFGGQRAVYGVRWYFFD